MTDAMDLGCAVMRTPFFEQVMETMRYFGRAGIAILVVGSLLAHGYFYDNRRTRKAGIALIIALLASAAVTELVRYAVQLPRPKESMGYGFPSGHTSAAFSLAAVLGVTFPQIGSLFYLIAVLTGISRLYYRAHYVTDVLGGAFIGVLIGAPLAKALVPYPLRGGRALFGSVGWTVVLIIGVAFGGFFYTVERNIAAQRLSEGSSSAGQSLLMTIDFGHPQARAALGTGWAGDELLENSKRTFVWATGSESEMALSLPVARDYLFRLNVFPYSPKGLTCQRIAVDVNGVPIAKLFLEKGWHWYGFEVPKPLVRTGVNKIKFSYDYAQRRVGPSRNTDSRLLSVAFDRLDVFSAN
jgi:undecaprenyl-diphosphatase